MTRIVGGLARGRRLAVPPEGTRPTSDRAREGLFNSLTAQLDFDGLRVLDLFAGSGAVGLEALSRGAATVELVDADAAAASVVRANVDAVGLPGARVVRADVRAYLAGTGGPFDVVFADPPYAFTEDDLAAVVAALVSGSWLASGSLIVVERSRRSPEPSWPDVIETVRSRRYGESLLWYGRRA